MDSEDSDDEPLSVIALKKQGNLEIEISPIYEPRSYSIEKKSHKKECEVLIALQPTFEKEPPVVKRPADVWLYLTDLNPTGPYNCLLCSEWFINRTRIVIHYVVNHKKDYCGICRYFVPNRESWWEHVKFHMPWKCSQCEDTFPSQMEWRVHFSSVHQLVHCRLCYLRLTDDEQYHTHLYKSHCVTTVASAYKEVLWEFECEGTQKFMCLLCSKSCNVGRQFADHYMAYHHLTLKCFMFLVSGIDLPFSFKGIDLSPEFVETELKSFDTLGYVDFVKKLKVEQEPSVTFEEVPITVDCDPAIKECNESNDEEDVKPVKEIKYKGEIDFDVTLMELVLLEKCYFQYLNMALTDINANVIPISSEISYIKDENSSKSIDCCFCKDEFKTNDLFETHMTKVHSVKAVPIYWCRVCAAAFDSLTELETHSNQELGDFDDLWICQFCEKEFDNREQTRRHLTEHWDMIDYDNCFSPHLGFKCKFCSTLFWNETDRETHHVRVHSQKRLSDFYKCTSCGEVFGDKVFFVHHYLDRHNSNNHTYLLKCCICCIVLQNVEDMRSHFEDDHPDDKKIFCSLEQCKYKPFRQKKSLVLHVKTVHYPSGRPRRSTTCNTCGMSFNSSKARRAHSAQVHGPGRYKCTICHEFLRTIDERKLHYLIRHPGRFQYQCDACDKSFQYKSSLYMHKQEHTPNKKDYPCTYCGKVFLKRDSYREHVMIHEAPRHACSYCPMRFVQRSNMLRHERRHTGERPYSCKMCPRTFSDKGACTSHSRTHLKTTSYTCMYCGQTFAQKSKLTYHIRKHTGENLETCSLCSKIFTSACSLREHMRVHQRKKMKKTIKCPLCKNMYPDEREMLRHVRASHTGARWRCPLCRKTVCSASSLREHVLTHSREHVYRCNVCPKAYHSKKSIIKHLQIRHGLKRQEITPKTSYRHLDPKECNLGLDDDVLEKIFGSFRRKLKPDLVLGDFVTFNKNLKLANYSQQNASAEPNIPDGASEEESAKEEDIQVKIEPMPTYDEEEVPSPDFVNVKIECVDIDYEQPSNTETA